MADALGELVQEVVCAMRQEPDVKIERFDSLGAGYTSALFKIRVTPQMPDDLHLFAKVASFGTSMRSKINADWMYSNEQFVYNKLVKVYDSIQRSKGLAVDHRFVFPKFYGCNSEYGKETIITEDLTARGFVSYDRLKSMDWTHATAAVETLARFHALSFAFELEQPEEFNRITKGMGYRMGSQEEDDSMKDLWCQMVEGAVAALDPEYAQRVRKLVYDQKFVSSYNKPIDKVVLAHGDYRLSNLFFKKEDVGLQVRAVDYQLVHAGCPVSDLIYFITVGSDQEFRARYFYDLVDYYHDQLALALDRLGLDIDDIYPRKTFDKELVEIMPHAVLIGVMVLPAVTVDTDAVPKMDESADVSNFMMKPNKLFTERFHGIVEDCIDWGVI
ncbi:uncharacterized protein [Battus philenor]|uniref:uncharacterized protein n=1 Tax=Battus philenor TaxID=42288 RepID=UPI0035CEFB39